MFVEVCEGASLGFLDLPHRFPLCPTYQETAGDERSSRQLNQMFLSVYEQYAQVRSRRNYFDS